MPAFLLLTSLPCLAQLPAALAPLEEARADLAHGKAAEAIVILEKLQASGPHQPGVAHDLGLAYYRTGRLQQARDAFTHAIESDPADLESVQMKGLALYRLGQPAAAIAYLERVKQFAPNANADANHVLGLCYLNAQRFDEARHAFAAQYSLDPASAGAYLLMARMLVAANLPEQGAAAAESAVALSPSLPLAHFLIGETALFKSDIPRATREFEAERLLNPAYAPVYERLGDVYSRTARYEQAEECLLKALSLDTSSTGPFLLMGKVLLRREDPQTAAMYLEHAEKMDPSNFIVHTLLGQAYRAQGREEQARSELDAAAKIHAASELELQQ